MPQSLSCVYLHIIFSTKDRFPFLVDIGIRDEIHTYLGGIARNQECLPVLIGGVADHVHLLVGLGRTISQADLIKELKRSSSLWIKERFPALSKFAWQAGYAAFSVSVSNLDAVREYVANQEEHHQRMSFQDELRAFLKKHGAVWDERHVWD
jgi:putative transposase